MHTLTKEEFTLKVEPILRQVFVGNNDTEPFLPHIEDRLLLYFPLGGDTEENNERENKIFEAIAEAAKSVGNTGCYFVIGWGWEWSEYATNRCAYISISELKEAFVPSSIGRNKMIWNQLDIEEEFIGFCLCSISGEWGLLKTIDDHAFLGGSFKFMQAVRDYFPDIEKEVLEYLHDLRLELIDIEKIDLTWSRQLLTHVYGKEEAEKLLKEAGLS
jgi:hypothetical protein